MVIDGCGGVKGREKSMMTPRFLAWISKCLEYKTGIYESLGIFPQNVLLNPFTLFYF